MDPFLIEECERLIVTYRERSGTLGGFKRLLAAVGRMLSSSTDKNDIKLLTRLIGMVQESAFREDLKQHISRLETDRGTWLYEAKRTLSEQLEKNDNAAFYGRLPPQIRMYFVLPTASSVFPWRSLRKKGLYREDHPAIRYLQDCHVVFYTTIPYHCDILKTHPVSGDWLCWNRYFNHLVNDLPISCDIPPQEIINRIVGEARIRMKNQPQWLYIVERCYADFQENLYADETPGG